MSVILEEAVRYSQRLGFLMEGSFLCRKSDVEEAEALVEVAVEVQRQLVTIRSIF